LLHELIGVEMLVMAEDMVHQPQSLRRHAHPAALQEFDKAVPRRQGNLHGAEGVGHRALIETTRRYDGRNLAKLSVTDEKPVSIRF
jgi:hypothetical protein